MWDEAFPAERDAALRHLVSDPLPPKAPKVSAWAQLGEIAAAPFKGAGQAANETARTTARLSTSTSLPSTALSLTGTDADVLDPIEAEVEVAPETELRRWMRTGKLNPLAKCCMQFVDGVPAVYHPQGGVGWSEDFVYVDSGGKPWPVDESGYPIIEERTFEQWAEIAQEQIDEARRRHEGEVGSQRYNIIRGRALADAGLMNTLGE